MLIALVALVSFYGCGQKKNDNSCKEKEQMEVGRAVFTAPACYWIVFPDTNNIAEAVLAKDDSVKFEVHINADVDPKFYVFYENDSMFNTRIDTINKNYIRQVCSFKKKGGYGLILNVVDIRARKSLWALSSDSVATLVIQASTPEDVSLSKGEMETFIEAFSTIQVKEEKEPEAPEPDKRQALLYIQENWV